MKKIFKKRKKELFFKEVLSPFTIFIYSTAFLKA